MYAEDGQLWGNPVYNWSVHKDENYEWWIKRIKHTLKFVDVLRIDYARAFSEYYEIDYGAPNARTGKWLPGPGIEFFNILKEKLDKPRLILEELGTIDDNVS